MKLLAIDPGCSGGFAWSDNETTTAIPMPDTEGDVLDRIRSLRAEGIEVAYVEDQVGCVGPGVRVSSSSMFTFGRGFGFLLGALMGMGFQVHLVRSQKWQKALSLGSKKDAGGNTPWKNKLKAKAQMVYPGVTVTLKTADALLLLMYATGQYGGPPNTQP